MVILLHPFFALSLTGTPTPLPLGQPSKKGGNTTIGNKTSLGHQCVNVAFTARGFASSALSRGAMPIGNTWSRPWHSAFRAHDQPSDRLRCAPITHPANRRCEAIGCSVSAQDDGGRRSTACSVGVYFNVATTLLSLQLKVLIDPGTSRRGRGQRLGEAGPRCDQPIMPAEQPRRLLDQPLKRRDDLFRSCWFRHHGNVRPLRPGELGIGRVDDERHPTLAQSLTYLGAAAVR